ncbi:hypothetical protein [Cystobacter fuscus]|uniref:hypothetical protein n=1 Tax=Cystobacter fuscus TaxID=43 RepID=UPI002B287B05|nr:hypothetical protein F0U63_02500 [Cystobacter fuscus]
MSDTLFSSDVETADTLHLGRQWLGDLLDLALSLLLGWGLLRALDVTRTPGRLIAVTAGVWCVVCLVGGLSGWTLGQALVGLRLGRGDGVPGASRGAARAPLALVDLLVSPILQRRVFDRTLGLEAKSVPPWRGGLPWKAAWLVLALAAVWFMVAPTRTETLRYLKTLDGWRCCHGRATPSPSRCENAVSRAVREAAGGDTQAQAVVADCPTAAAAMGR